MRRSTTFSTTMMTWACKTKVGRFSLLGFPFSCRPDSDGDDGMDMDDFKVAPKTTRKAYEIEYESLTQSAIEKLMERDVEHIRGIFGVDTSTAGLLLRYMSWNKERLIEKYMDNANKMLVAAGVVVPEPEPARPSRRPTRKPKSPAKSDTFVCSICFDDAPDLTPLALDCGHAACTGCWSAYITSKIRDEAEHACRCMAEGCALVAPDAFVRAAVDDETYTRFQELLVRHFVSCSAELKFCPYPACTNTVSCPAAASKASLTTVVPIVSCGARGIASTSTAPVSMTQSQELRREVTGKEHKFCFGCIVDSDHRPVVCGVALLWLKKCRDDSETANWIKSNTKECGKCMSTIEKNGGCKCVSFSLFLLRGAHPLFAQPHDVQEVQARVLLGVHGPVVGARHRVVLVQSLRREGRRRRTRLTEQEPCEPRAVSPRTSPPPPPSHCSDGA
jgi:ariadne-1